MATLKLKKAVTINDKEVKEIEYDLEELTGKDLQHATKELSKRGIVCSFNEFDQNYHAMVFSIAADLAFEDMDRFCGKDYMSACNAVRDFFLEE